MNGARQNILIFAELVKNHYRKTPIFYGNHNNLSNFLDSRFDSYMIWMGFWGKTSVKLGGSNPGRSGSILAMKRYLELDRKLNLKFFSAQKSSINNSDRAILTLL